ncbi:MAG: Eco57I restriction-modification methylase domain-containing protein [Alphaproteobacteria bacterium]|nr:MAG: SAM-dependent methyltransferase [Rickettsiaceae bacterium 4572_127]
MKLDIKNLGQVFTPSFIVSKMINLIKNKGRILEPSAGDGTFSKELSQPNLTSIEYDKALAEKNNFINKDFFDYKLENKFDTIIGNPPYIRHQDITKKTKKHLEKNKIYFSIFDNRSNLYLFFIYKSILHLKKNGELIFITPRDFLKATSSIKLNNFIYSQGTITDIMELGDKKIFDSAQPNTVFWRFEKDNFTRKTSAKKNFILNKGQLLFTKKKYSVNFSDIAFVKVGAVSGGDKYFMNKDGINFVCSYTNKTGKTKKMLYNRSHKDLEKVKDKLLNRKIRKFDERNWCEWGRKYYESDEKRIYVNGKTRNKKPFFISDVKAYDGSILAVFPKANLTKNELEKFCNELNNVDWEELGFVVDGRFIFGQKSLENTLLPNNFNEYKK